MSPTAPDHFVIATAGAYGHMPPLLGVAIALAEADPGIQVSLILHTNNTPGAERLLASTPEIKDRIKLYPTGTPSALRDRIKSYADMLMHGGEQYAAILAVSEFFYVVEQRLICTGLDSTTSHGILLRHQCVFLLRSQDGGGEKLPTHHTPESRRVWHLAAIPHAIVRGTRYGGTLTH